MTIKQNTDNTLDSSNQEELDHNQESQQHETSQINPLGGAASIVALTGLFVGAALVGAFSLLEAQRQVEPDLANEME